MTDEEKEKELMSLEEALDMHKRWVMDSLDPQRRSRRVAPQEPKVGDRKVTLPNRGEMTLQEALDLLCRNIDDISTRQKQLEVELSKLGRWIP